MNTFILKWNPTVSAYKMEQFTHDIEELSEGGSISINWPLNHEHRVRYGDRFFMISEGKNGNGIVMAGYFCSDSYIDDNDVNEHAYVADIDPLVAVNPSETPFISIDELKEAVKDFDWENCISGSFIADDKAALLEHLWIQYLYNNQDIFDGYRAGKSWDFDLEDFESVPSTLQTYYKQRYGSNCEKCNRTEAEVSEMAYHVVLDDYDPEHPAPFINHLHCYCSECWFGVNDEE